LKRTPFRIRGAQKSDKAALALVYQTAFSSSAYSEKWPLSSAQKRILELLTDPRTSSWVAVVFGQPVGFAFLQTRQGFNGPYAEILETAVHPYFQAQGLEKALFNEMKRFKKRNKVKTLFALTYRGASEKIFRESGLARSKKSLIYVMK
jgi:ribosomal protein S18 acetylase RimI-like enzyme